MDDQPPGRTVHLPRPSRRQFGRAMALALPLALGGSFGPALAAFPTGWQGSLEDTAGDPGWLNSLTGPVPTTPGAQPGAVPEPGIAVVPLNGDPQQLALPAPSTGAPPSAAPPAVGDTTTTGRLASSGIPLRVLQAYLAAAATTARTTPGCHLTWSLLAGIGRIETNHGRYGGAGITAGGLVTPPIYGPRLDGSGGMPSVRDTDGGRLDGLATSDRAVGPMQFLPGTWTSVATDADGDGVVEPQDVDDASLAAARYLCLGGTDLATPTGRWEAVYRYNRSGSYVSLVLAMADSYATGVAAPVQAAPSGVRTPVSAVSAPASTPPGITSTTTQLPTAAAPSTSVLTTQGVTTQVVTTLSEVGTPMLPTTTVIITVPATTITTTTDSGAQTAGPSTTGPSTTGPSTGTTATTTITPPSTTTPPATTAPPAETTPLATTTPPAETTATSTPPAPVTTTAVTTTALATSPATTTLDATTPATTDPTSTPAALTAPATTAAATTAATASTTADPVTPVAS